MKIVWKSIEYLWCKTVWNLISYLWRKVRPTTVLEALKKEEVRANRAWTSAFYSKLGWISDLQPKLKKIAASLVTQEGILEHNYHFISSDNNRYHFQISAYANRTYPEIPGENCNPTTVKEDPASIVFSFHPNGSVKVIVYPHKSSWMTFGRDAHYIVGNYDSTNDLAGSRGSKIIGEHIKSFLNLVSLSLAVSIPTKSTSRLLEKLELKTNQHSRIYSSKNEQRRAIVESELALGAGLAAGLIASTLFPMAQSIGKDAAESVKNIVTHCKAHDPRVYQDCLKRSSYHIEKFVSIILSAEILMVAAAVIVMFVVGIMWRRLKSR